MGLHTTGVSMRFGSLPVLSVSSVSHGLSALRIAVCVSYKLFSWVWGEPDLWYYRKEPFANGFWSTKAENWNGRVAMMGFTALIVTEALSGKSIPQFYFGL